MSIKATIIDNYFFETKINKNQWSSFVLLIKGNSLPVEQ